MEQSLYVAAVLATGVLGVPFEKALLDDMFPAPSARCQLGGGETANTFEFPGSDPQSEWYAPFVSFEKDVFLAQMQHYDPNTNRTWRARIGKGGNLYSFVGAFGEAMPPQNHELAPWIDEVWQMVAVDQSKNGKQVLPQQTQADPYFIHQAGTYQKDEGVTARPFYSPNVAAHCSGRTCSTAAWGQHAHVPTHFTSPMLCE
jgi:hypothetical protein